ncbi:thiamine biosynthesis protein [Hippea maritima]|uniref:Thiamine biosynthesis protein n=1 Tax=Hippea maritima (strain ATCC 700847 / DSM 10411 / MH2) TaxID=760142 RepID=F2LTW8_HIPMA|nr:thiamine biosynthesis protein [Hippea maritima]AEA34494.1 Thiamine biosynthesis protein [Hippea maritima DSM 10411]
MKNLNKKCVALYSGGLDSLLAILIVKSLGVEVYPLFVQTPFYNKEIDKLKEQLNKSGLALETARDDKAYIEMLLNPRFGYGKNLNPCIDCKAFFYKKAKEYADKIGASFIITGEVLGQRPMSQRSYTVLRTIEKHAGLIDLVLRPLSAKCLKETIMEKEGIVDRDKLYCIQGRTRKAQFELAKTFGIEEFESPAGGCLLTDTQFSARLKEMLDKKDELNSPVAIELLKIGRHFRVDGFKFIVSRNAEETKFLTDNFSDLPQIRCLNSPGGVGVFLKEPHIETIITAAAILKRYSKKAQNLIFKGSREFIIDVKPMSDERLNSYRVGGDNA